jgi:hypothetical protein
MNKLEEYFDVLSPLLNGDGFTLGANTKNTVFEKLLQILSEYHAAGNHLYNNFYESTRRVDASKHYGCYLPTTAFKEFNLQTTFGDDAGVVKELLSSGTTGSKQSKIYLSAKSSQIQMKVLTKILTKFLGSERRPLLIFDAKPNSTERSQFSARVAASRGFQLISSKTEYALNDDMSLNYEATSSFLENYRDASFFIFGFTFLLYTSLVKNRTNLGKLDFSNATVIHGGGWKKMSDQGLSNKQFKAALLDNFGIKKIHNYYGLVEQLGSIFFECSAGYLHASDFSNVHILDNRNVSLKAGTGLIALDSLLPISYPGHRLITEDLGQIVYEDTCPCGLSGMAFEVFGRIPRVQIRGCSDAIN